MEMASNFAKVVGLLVVLHLVQSRTVDGQAGGFELPNVIPNDIAGNSERQVFKTEPPNFISNFQEKDLENQEKPDFDTVDQKGNLAELQEARDEGTREDVPEVQGRTVQKRETENDQPKEILNDITADSKRLLENQEQSVFDTFDGKRQESRNTRNTEAEFGRVGRSLGGLVLTTQLQDRILRFSSNLHPSEVITVNGFIPANCVRFSVNLLRTTSDEETIVLHVDVRFDENRFVTGVRQNGEWKFVEVFLPFPAKRNSYFECTITVLPDKYQFMYNGQYIFEYRQRIPPEWVNSIAVWGTVQAYSIRRIQNIQ